MFLLACSIAFAQGGSLSGVVVDTNGGIIPGASVVVKNHATNTTFESVTNAEGVFSVPALDAGTYTVTVSLSGFKTEQLNEVRIAPATPNSVKAVLEVGSVSETIDVTSSSEIINTQKATIAVDAERRPDQQDAAADPQRVQRGDVPARRRHRGHQPRLEVQRPAQSFINITLDGVSNNDNFNKTTDGFFAIGDAPSGRGRGGQRDQRRRRRRHRRPRRGGDRLPDPLGDQPPHRQCLRVLPPPVLNSNTTSTIADLPKNDVS